MNKKPADFEFTSYKFEPDNKRIFFNYRQYFKNGESINFTETLLLPEVSDLSSLPNGLIDKILQCIHLVLGISYYKFYCATKVKHFYSLTKDEADFWNVIYKKGLGEFFYKNKLDPKISPKFSFDKKSLAKNFEIKKYNKCLVAVSGGKDSLVATELLKEQGIDIAAMFTEAQRESKLVNKVIEILGVKSFKFRRILDEKAFQKHQYDGHVPVSAMFAFFGILYAVLYKYSYCVMANEFSSNFGNIKYKGLEINHQWSKSFEFEKMFSDYVQKFISPDVKYFSLLRPFYEIRIAKIFSNYKKYFPYFSSCNKNFKLIEEKKAGLWCGECPKCVFAFILFSAFLTKEELLEIFGKNLYQNQNLLPLFKDILGLGNMKPFDCVGTFEESRVAFLLGSEKFKNDFIVKSLRPKIKFEKDLVKKLFATQQSPNIPAQFKFSGMQKVLILGCGKEGEISQKYIEKKYPNLEIGFADQKAGKKYLEKQYNFDIAVKTPGIKKELVKIPYVTATNLFFALGKNNKNKIIGVTGSKGKSTTASLIYKILQSAGKNVSLLGNIGNPMLSAFLDPVDENKIFVVELSSYQLDDIEFSPDIAVVTNLFPEHMNYHNGKDNYYLAKKKIIDFQESKDVFVYNARDKKLLEWAKKCKSRVVPFVDNNYFKEINFPLIGEHNKQNAAAAVVVAKEFGISDSVIKNAIEKFTPLPHRLEFVGEFKRIKFYDDAISTTPESTIKAIESLGNVDTIFLGGEDRGYNFLQLEKTIKKYKINNAVLFPETGQKIKVDWLNSKKTKSMEEAVKFAYKHTKPGGICLLSCASPSYSVWKNFEEKGDQFKKFVKELANEKTV